MERYHIFKLGLAILFYAAYCIRPQVVNGQKIEENETQTQKFDESDLVFYQGVEGKPGVDFPVLSHIPRTSFNCRDVGSGYYADLETDCQVFHICEDNKKISFLCPNGTIFEQSELICEWWFKVNCTNSPNLYEESAEQLREEEAKRKLSRRVNHHGAVMRTEERSSVSAKQNGRNFEAGGRASKRVPLNGDNRLNNHAPTYRDNLEEVQSNDLSRSSTSDFVRNRNNNFGTHKQNENRENVDSVRNRKKPVQFQAQPSADNEDSNVKKESSQRNQNVRNNRNRSGTRRRLEPSDNRNQNFVSNSRNQGTNSNSESGFNKDVKVQVNGQQNFFSTTDANRNSQNNNNFNRGQTKFNNRQPSNSNQDSFNNEELAADHDNQFDFSKTSNRNRESFSSNQNVFDNSRNRISAAGTTEQEKNLGNDQQTSNRHQESFPNNRGTLQTKNSFNNFRNPDFSTQNSPQNAFGNYKNQNRISTSGTTQQEQNSGNNQQAPNKHQESFSNSHNNFRNKEQTSGSTEFYINTNNDNDDDEQSSQTNINQESQDPSKTQNAFDNSKIRTSAFSTTQQKQNLGNNRQIPSQPQESFPSNRGASRTDKSFSNFRNNYGSDKESSQTNPNQENKHPQIKINNFKNQNGDTQQNSFSNQYVISQTNSNHRESFSIRNSNHQSNSEINDQNPNHFINDFSEPTSVSVSDRKHHQSFSFGSNKPTSNPDYQNNNRFYNSGSESTPCQHSSPNLEKDTKKDSKQPNTYSNDNEEPQKPIALSTISQPNKNVQDDIKTTTVKQTSSVPLTRNDIVNRRLEHTDQEETQVTQETASFYKNSRNRIDQSSKSTSPNPHPNHRETYSELKEPKYFTTKAFSSISSVTPQYLTTQPINNGRPFIGSQVGTTLSNFKTTTTTNYFSTTSIPSTTNNLFNVGKTDSTLAPISTEAPSTLSVPTEIFNIGRTDKSLRPVALSTFATPGAPANVTIPPEGSFNLGTSTPKIGTSTKKIIDHATVYGKFVKSSSTPQPSKNTKILLSKSLFGGATPAPFSKPTKGSSEILSTSDSYNRGDSQVRFFGKVQSSKKISGVELSFNGDSKASPNSFSTTPKPFSLSTTPKPFSPSTTQNDFSTSTINPEYNSVTPLSISTFNPEFHSVTPTYLSTTESPQETPTFFSTTSNPELNSISTTDSFSTTEKYSNTISPKPKVSGFFVTRNNDDAFTTEKSRISKIIRPRPFELPPPVDFRGKAIYTTTEDIPTTPAPTYPTYKISSASPFAEPSTLAPTQPTPFTTALPTTFENVDSMINALAEMATQNFSDSPRPGLIIPPSAGPQTLHTLAVYFANALDGIAADKEEENVEEEDESNLSRVELEKKRITELLTQMTMDRYNELFHEEQEEKEEKQEEATTVSSRSGADDEDNDLEGQHSKGLAQEPPKVRQLAKVFTQALSSYLDDPANFKKVLEEIRPTEPPGFDGDDGSDDELLNFSDADSKSSYPPFYPTIPSAHPTWGFLLAYNNTPQNLDVRNSINPENENLQGADSQSFVSQFNKLQTTNKPSTQLPEDHWTSSPDAHKLFKSAFAFDPASINENFGTTESSFVPTEEGTEDPEPIEETHHEIKYELKALPNLELNSTQVHGILIDFMNTTKKNDDNRLQRILRKLNTTEDEFLTKMKEIENNPLTRRLILLLISECGSNVTEQAEARVLPLQHLLPPENNTEVLQTSSSIAGFGERIPKLQSSSSFQIADRSLDEDNQDTRALQLLNSLYTIASKFGK